MLLATASDTDNGHLFLYACMLGIYHANVIYAVDATQTYQAKWFEFLWVQWFEYQGQSVRWSNLKLDSITLPSVTSEGAFGFVDPGDVLQACHIIPTFSSDKKYHDATGLSRCADDSQDWCQYYINQ